jgi:predicted AAA+ superfamily ATPase
MKPINIIARDWRKTNEIFLEMAFLLLKGYWHNGRRAPFYYYRDKDRTEIDLLIVQDGTAYPLEFKKTASPGRDDVRHFQLTERSLPLTPTAQSIPVAAI